MLALLDRLTRQAGKNLIMVTHSPEVGRDRADRVFHLHEGKLEYDPAFRRRVRDRLAAWRSSPGFLPMSHALRNVGWRYLLRHPWQTALMVVGITLGVAVMVAIDLANSAASRAFDLSTDAVAGRATHQIIGGPAGLDEALYARLRGAGVQAAAPVVTDYVTSPQLGGRPIQLLGIDPFAEAPFRSYLVPSARAGLQTVPNSGLSKQTDISQLIAFLTHPGALLISEGLAADNGLEIGDRVALRCRRPAHDRLRRRAVAPGGRAEPPRAGRPDPGRHRHRAGGHRPAGAVGSHRPDPAGRQR